MKRFLLPGLLSLLSLSRAAVVTSFEEASLPAAVLLDVPNAALGSITFDAVNDELDFNASGGTDMWGTRNNAPIAWTAIPSGLVNGSTWMVETEVRLNNVTQNNQVAGITFYGGPDGAKPDISFGLDNWDPAARAVRLQGLGDNVPNTAIATTASRVFLRVLVQEGGATDTYNFYFKANADDAWQQIPGAAINYQTGFSNARVGLVYKTGAAKAGAAFTYFSVQDLSALPPAITVPPVPLTAIEGGVGRFSLTATGAVSYQWRRNGVNITPGGNQAVLTLDPVTAADHGAGFDCVVGNAHGTGTSPVAALSVIPAPAGSGYYSSAVQAEPSLFAYFPVDGSLSPAVKNVKNPAFSGTVNGDAAHDSTASRTIGAKSVASNGGGWVGVTRDPAWDFADGNGTIEMWVYHAAAASYNPSLIAVRNDAAGGTRYSFHADAAGTRIWYFNGSGAPVWTLPSNSIGRLMHLAFVIANGQCTLYHNGVSLGAVTHPLGGGVNLPAVIGAAGPGTQESFPGSLDEVALYADPLPASAIAAHYNAWFTSTAGRAPLVQTAPASQSVNEGAPAGFTVELADPAGAVYRWQRDGVDIPGATAAAYTLTSATMADHGARFRCVVYNAYGGTLTPGATLTVKDVNAPQLLSAAAPVQAGQIVLTFNEAVDLSGASFTVEGGTVTAALPGPLPDMVMLTVSGLAAGQSSRVTAENVRDTAGNALATGSVSFTAAPAPVAAPIELVRPAAEPAGPATRRGPFVFSEIHYHPRDRADQQNLEFIELYNAQPWAEDLTGFRITGEVDYRFPAGTMIPAGGRLVIAAVPGHVQSVYGISGVLGPWSGVLNNGGGQLRLRDTSNGVVFEVDYGAGNPWPAAADGAGHSLVLARPSYGMQDPAAWESGFPLDGTPGAAEPVEAGPWRSVVINEMAPAAAAPGEFIELYNYSTAPVDVSGCVLSDDRTAAKFIIPASTVIPAGGFLSFTQARLGFGLKAGGDTVFFRAPSSGGEPGRVLEAVRFGPQRAGTAWGRYPDGAAGFAALGAASAGAPNEAPAAAAAVISEILYHPPAGSSQLPFVEITNTSGTLLDLGGWRLRGGIRYDVPPETRLAPGASLAVQAFSGSLNKGTGEPLRLEMPVEDADSPFPVTVYPVVDEVTYGTGGRWGRWSDGGGSSLERKDLRSDGREAASWADSSVDGATAWVTVQTTGVMDNGSGVAINRLHLMLAGAGECLVDDVEVIPAGGANVVLNPGFELGASSWMIQGTHDRSTVEPGGFSGGSAMHLRAAGRGDLAGNRLSVPLSASLAAGGTATIRARVKWLRGHPGIILRLAGGVLEAAGNILPPGLLAGTPGAVNSAATPNAGPAISRVTHLPVLPQAGQKATIFARITDPDHPGLAFVRYRLDPSPVQATVVMSYRGAGFFSAEIPAQAAGTLAAYTISASDSAGAVSSFPANGQECLIRWGEPNPPGNLPAYRLWMTEATRAEWAGRLKNSNTPLDVTFLYGDSRVIYNASAQYSGSPWHTGGFSGPTAGNCDYDCTVPPDDRFLGETDFILAGPGTFGDDASLIREQTIWWIARKLGLPSIHRRFCRVMINGALRQTVFEDTQQPGGEWIDEYWPGDNDGILHKAQDWIEYGDDGATFGTTLRAFLGKRTTAGGMHKDASYRYQWAVRSAAGTAGEWGPFHSLVDAFATGTSGSDPAFFHAVDPLIDQDSWARAFAVQRIAGNWDTWGYTYGKNMYLYKPVNGPWALTAWDIDFSFGLVGDPATTGLEVNTQDPLVTKFRTQPAFRRAWWCAFREAVDGPMLPATANARIDAMVAGLAAGGVTASSAQVAAVKTYLSERRNYIITQLNAAYPGTVFGISGSNTLTDADGVLTLNGTAPPGVKSFRINGVDYNPVWTSETAWSLPLTLYAQSGSLTVQGLDLRGGVVASFPVSITVTGPPPLPPVRINEWMAGNTSGSGFADPADGKFDDWFELHNHGTSAVNLSGFYLTDTPADRSQFAIPAGTIIPAGGHLLIWADGDPAQNGVTPGQLHVNFRLNAAGESLGLYTPDGTAVDLVSFGPQETDRSEGRYPDSAPDIVFPVPTPGRRNALSPDIIAIIPAGAGASGVTFSTEPSQVYQVESSADLHSWTAWGDPVTAVESGTTVNLPLSGLRRFWRARLVAP